MAGGRAHAQVLRTPAVALSIVAADACSVLAIPLSSVGSIQIVVMAGSSATRGGEQVENAAADVVRFGAGTEPVLSAADGGAATEQRADGDLGGRRARGADGEVGQVRGVVHGEGEE